MKYQIVPFLPVRDDFHPKRNQARQKLATLPKSRFKDLSGDVFHELGRRYPEFREPEVGYCNFSSVSILTSAFPYRFLQIRHRLHQITTIWTFHRLIFPKQTKVLVLLP